MHFVDEIKITLITEVSMRDSHEIQICNPAWLYQAFRSNDNLVR